jgi:hypothetical protein
MAPGRGAARLGPRLARLTRYAATRHTGGNIKGTPETK